MKIEEENLKSYVSLIHIHIWVATNCLDVKWIYNKSQGRLTNVSKLIFRFFFISICISFIFQEISSQTSFETWYETCWEIVMKCRRWEEAELNINNSFKSLSIYQNSQQTNWCISHHLSVPSRCLFCALKYD